MVGGGCAESVAAAARRCVGAVGVLPSSMRWSGRVVGEQATMRARDGRCRRCGGERRDGRCRQRQQQLRQRLAVWKRRKRGSRAAVCGAVGLRVVSQRWLHCLFRSTPPPPPPHPTTTTPLTTPTESTRTPPLLTWRWWARWPQMTTASPTAFLLSQRSSASSTSPTSLPPLLHHCPASQPAPPPLRLLHLPHPTPPSSPPPHTAPTPCTSSQRSARGLSSSASCYTPPTWRAHWGRARWTASTGAI